MARCYDARMSLQAFLAQERGRAVKVARDIRVHPVLVRQWAAGSRRVPLEHCAALERATHGAFRRWEHYPNDWHRIWPELVGTEGAPEPIVGEQQEAA